MVLNLCLPPFYTTVHCNKLCADGYDVTNLVSADPALRRRGFKLEYFLRPPLQVTLKFDFQVELCRIDVEMWPSGMDRGQECKKLEISTSSDPLRTQNFGQGHKRVQQKKDMQVKHQKQSRENEQEHDGESHQSNRDQWRLQAQQRGEGAPDEPQQGDHAFKSHTESSNPTPEFKLIGRCELREETKVCFTRSNFRPRRPFVSTLPPQPTNCRQEELWSRGLLSLGAVTQLRVTVPFGSAGTALGLKALAVWGQPAHCCTAEEVERIKSVHEANKRLLPQPVFFAPSVRQRKPPLPAGTPPSNISVPEEFLDQITQEVMMLPMLLPSGVSVDNTTLEEHQKREATWGRPPNDPFTGVPFTSTSQPLPNPQLKSRIDHFVLQKGLMRRDGMVGSQREGENPQASRLAASKVDGQSQCSPCPSESSTNNNVIRYNAGTKNTNRTTQMEDTGLGCSSVGKRKKQDLSGICNESAAENLLPQTKRPRNDAVAFPSCSSHEQRLSASLDEALFSALQGRPSFTSNLPQQRPVLLSDAEPLNISQHCQTAGAANMPPGEKTCSACSCSVSAYSKGASSIYRLTCGHLLCRSCLRRESQPVNPIPLSTASHILCPACQSPSPRSDVIRVHH